MGIRTFTITAKALSEDPYLRKDVKYHYFLSSSGWNLFNSSVRLISLKDVLSEDYNLFDYKKDKVYKGIPTGQTYLDEDGCIKDFLPVNTEQHPDRLKYKVSNENILISSLRLAKSPALFYEIEDLSDYVFSNGFYIFKVNDEWNKKFVLYILRTKKLKNIIDNHIYRGIGISAYKKNDLLKIKIPLIPKIKQDQIVAQIEPIEKEIRELKAHILPTQEVINKAFSKEFGFDLEKLEELKRIKHYYLDISTASQNKDLRNSVAFHQESARFVMAELKKITKSKIKHYIDEPITLGASISPSNFDDQGNYYYISMATVKDYYLEIDDTQLVSPEYANNNINKAVNKYDIIMTRSGVAIGKFALVEDDVKGIFADFTMRIRLRNYNPYFAYYYFRSDYFQHLIHSNKKGLQNKNIFPGQIKEFPLIDCPSNEQQNKVDEIELELTRQKGIASIIECKRNKIDEIIEKAVY